MKIFSDIAYAGESPLQKLDIILPDEGSIFPVFIYIHGGGIENGDKAGLNFFSTMTDRGIAIVSINYRMYPNTKYPEFIEDCAMATDWTMKNIGRYCKPRGFYLGGSSAGGYLSMMLCFDKRWLAPYGIKPTDIDGYIHDAGQPTAHFNVLKYSGIDSKRVIVDETAPLYHIGVDEKYSRMLFIVSDNDRENRYEQTLLVLSTLKHFGHTEPEVTWKLMHGKHCEYLRDYMLSPEGVSPFGTVAADFILGK